MLRYPALLLSCFVLAACSGSAMNDPDPLDTLPSGAWRLVAFVAADADAPQAPEADSTLQIDAAESRIAGLAGCNRYTGGYEIGKGKLSIGPLAATKRLCPEPAMGQERRFLGWLGRTASARLVGEQLELLTEEGDVLRFDRLPES